MTNGSSNTKPLPPPKRKQKRPFLTHRRKVAAAAAGALALGIGSKHALNHATGYTGVNINHKSTGLGPRNANGNPPLSHMQWNNKLSGIPRPGNNSPSRYTTGYANNHTRGKLAHAQRKIKSLRKAASNSRRARSASKKRKLGAKKLAGRTRRAATS